MVMSNTKNIDLAFVHFICSETRGRQGREGWGSLKRQNRGVFSLLPFRCRPLVGNQKQPSLPSALLRVNVAWRGLIMSV